MKLLISWSENEWEILKKNGKKLKRVGRSEKKWEVIVFMFKEQARVVRNEKKREGKLSLFPQKEHSAIRMTIYLLLHQKIRGDNICIIIKHFQVSFLLLLKLTCYII